MQGIKDLGQLTALCLAAFTVLGSYSQVLANPVPAASSPQGQEVQIAANSTIARQTVALPDALLGRWITNAGNTQYYFSRDRLTIINVFQRQDPRHYQQEMEYEITAVNEAEGLIFLKVETPLGWAETRMIRLTPDRQALTELMNVVGHEFSSEWTYVDGSQQPLVAEQPSRT